MKALVLYESFFGNTMEIGQRVANGLRGQFEVEVAEINEPHGELEQADLLVIGGPTHVLGMSKNRTREGARKKAEEKGIKPISSTGGMRELLEDLVNGQHQPLVATFDTSIKKRWLPLGSAAKTASKRLKKKGFELVVDAEQFRVAGTEGPLEAGELERAEEWGGTLAAEAYKKLSVVEPMTVA